MTDASPPFALPLRFKLDEYSYAQSYGWIMDADGETATMCQVHRTIAEAIIRAVNSYGKMREALEKIGKQKKTDELETACDVEYADFEQGYDDSIAIARAILKEIDNG